MRQLYVLKVMLVVSKSMLSVKYFCSNKAYFCASQILWRSRGCYKDEVDMATLSFGDITGFKAVAVGGWQRVLLFVSVEFGDHKTVTMLRYIWLLTVLGILPDLRQWCLS